MWTNPLSWPRQERLALASVVLATISVFIAFGLLRRLRKMDAENDRLAGK